MADGTIGSVGVAVVPDARNFWRRFEEQTRGGAVESGRRAGEDWERGFRAGAGEPDINVRVRADTSQARAQIAALQRDSHGLLGTLLTLSPALVPIAGAAALGGAALVEMGVAGALAIKGISDDIKAANADGIKFSAGLNVLKGDFGELSSTAAHNILGAFQEATVKLHSVLPSVNNDIGQSAQILGDIGGHVLTGLLGGLHNFSPALLTIETGVDHLAGRFEAWATGPGGARFGQTLADDFEQVGPLLSNLTTLVGHLVAASNSTGLGIVGELTTFAKVLNDIPTPVLSALIGGIVGLKIASTVSEKMNQLAGSIRGVTDAENGEGGSAFRGRLGAVIGTVGAVAAAWAGATAVIGTANAATKDWATSTSDLQYGAHYLVGTFNDLLTFNFKGFWGDVTGTGAAKQAAEMRGHILAINDATNLLAGDAHKVGLQLAVAAQNAREASSNVLVLHGNTFGFRPSSQVTGNFDPNVVAVSSATRVATQEATTYQATIRGLMSTLGAFYVQMQNAPLSQVTQAYTQQASSIDKANRSLQNFLTSGTKTDYTYKGITVGVNAWDAALTKTNGDVAAAEGIINGQIDALQRQKGVYADLSGGALRLGEAIGAASTKYKLSTDQVDSYAAALGISSDAVARGTISQQQFLTAIGGVADAFSHGNTAINQWVAAVNQFDKAGDTAASRGQLIGEALRAANGDALAYAGSLATASAATNSLVDAFTQQFSQLAQQASAAGSSGQSVERAQRQVETANARVAAAHARVEHVRRTATSTTAQQTAAEAALTSAQNSAANAASKLATAQSTAGSASALAYEDTERAAIHFSRTVHGLTAEIDTSAKGAGPLIQQLQGMQTAAMNAASATYQHEDSLHKASAADDAFAVYVDGTRQALIRQHDQLHLTKKQAKALADEYFGIKNSGDLKKQIKLIGQDKVLTALNSILTDLDILSGKTTILDIQINARNRDNIKSGAGRGVGGPHRLMATGGYVDGSGPMGVDSVPILGAPGEFMMSDKAVSRFGVGFFAALNAGIMPSRSDGSGRSGRPVNFTQINNYPLPERASASPSTMRAATSRLGRL